MVRTGVPRFTSPASGSVPVFTDHRSTPQVGLCTVIVMGAVAVSFANVFGFELQYAADGELQEIR